MKTFIFNVDENLSYQKMLNINGSAFIWGSVGIGKTNFAVEFLKNNDELSKYFLNIPKWVKDIMNNWYIKTEFKPNLNPKIDAKILILDDLGAELFNKNTYGDIYNLLNERYEIIQQNNTKNYITIVTSNFSLIKLKNHYLKQKDIEKIDVERLISRLIGLIDYEINFIGLDKRNRHNLEILKKDKKDD